MGTQTPFLENRLWGFSTHRSTCPRHSVVFRSLTLEAVPEPNSGLLFVFGIMQRFGRDTSQAVTADLSAVVPWQGETHFSHALQNFKQIVRRAPTCTTV